MPTDVSSSSTESYDSTVLAPATGDVRSSASVRNPLANIVNRVRFVFQRVQEIVGFFAPIGGLFPAALAVSGSTFTLAGHGLSANDPVRFWAIGSGAGLPSPLAIATTYYVVSSGLTSSTFQVSATSGGSAITLTSSGSGSIYAAKEGAASIAQLLLGALTPSSVTTTGAIAGASCAISGNETIGGNCTVTGEIAGGSCAITGNQTVGGYLTVTGSIEAGSIDSNGPIYAQGTGASLATDVGCDLNTAASVPNPSTGFLRLWWNGTNLKAVTSGGTSHTIF